MSEEETPLSLEELHRLLEVRQVLLESIRDSIRMVKYICLCILVLISASLWVVQSRNKLIRHVDETVATVNVQVDELTKFTDDIKKNQATQQSQDRSAAIANAVRIIPEIKVILCTVFPEACATTQSGG
jgi:uncharacterized protein YoxC